MQVFMSWDEIKITKLKELWGKGNTASQIAEIIGGISRNAVIGKAHRLNLSAKIKTRTATSNQSFESSMANNKIKSRSARKNKFRSLILNQKTQNNQKNQMKVLANGLLVILMNKFFIFVGDPH